MHNVSHVTVRQMLEMRRRSVPEKLSHSAWRQVFHHEHRKQSTTCTTWPRAYTDLNLCFLSFRTTTALLALFFPTTLSVWRAGWCVPRATCAWGVATCSLLRRDPSTSEACNSSLLRCKCGEEKWKFTLKRQRLSGYNFLSLLTDFHEDEDPSNPGSRSRCGRSWWCVSRSGGADRMWTGKHQLCHFPCASRLHQPHHLREVLVHRWTEVKIAPCQTLATFCHSIPSEICWPILNVNGVIMNPLIIIIVVPISKSVFIYIAFYVFYPGADSFYKNLYFDNLKK